MTEWKGAQYIDLTFAQNAQTSSGASFGPGIVPVALETPAGWTQADVSIEVDVSDDGSGDLRRVFGGGADYTEYGVAPNKRLYWDPKAVAHLIDGKPLRLYSSVAQTNAVTVRLRGAWQTL